MRSKKNGRSATAIYRILRGIIRLLGGIPWAAGQRIGRQLGGFMSLLPLARPRVALDNIRAVYGGDMSVGGSKELYRQLVMHFAGMIFEVPHIFKLNLDNLERYVVFENPERFEAAIRRGKGCFILTAHMGNWELMNAAMGLKYIGDRSAVVARPLDFQPLERLVRDMRTRFGASVIFKDHGMRRIMQAIRANQAVGILLDQNVDWYQGVFVPFLGRWACTNKGLALMALKTGAPVLPVFSWRQADGRYRIVVEEEVPLQVTGDKTRDVEENTAAYTAVIERWVRRYPEQWFWFHRRWKTQPYCSLSPGDMVVGAASLRAGTGTLPGFSRGCHAPEGSGKLS